MGNTAQSGIVPILIFIYQTTKEGHFCSKNENAHEVDVIIEVTAEQGWHYALT